MTNFAPIGLSNVNFLNPILIILLILHLFAPQIAMSGSLTFHESLTGTRTQLGILP